MIDQAEGVAVRQSILVQAPPERAFEVFTAGMSSWWPLDSFRWLRVVATPSSRRQRHRMRLH